MLYMATMYTGFTVLYLVLSLYI